jgi:hypothetical protein
VEKRLKERSRGISICIKNENNQKKNYTKAVLDEKLSA